MKYKVKILSHNKSITASDDDLLTEKIQESGINLSAYCNKRGLCGKCFVEILEGKLPPPEKNEELWIQQKKLNRNYRLACLYKITSDISINIPEESLIHEALILDSGISSPFPFDPPLKILQMHIEKPEALSQAALLNSLKFHLKKKHLVISSQTLKKLQDIISQNTPLINTAAYDDNEILDVFPGEEQQKAYGLAIDIGTTTVVITLMNLDTGEKVGSTTAMNLQMKYGLDIISRISYAIMSQENLDTLRNSIVKILNKMIEQVLTQNKIPSSFVYEAVVAGNTTMNHFLLGKSVQSLAKAPFRSAFSLLSAQSAQKVGLRINSKGKVYVVPNIESFVGGDISAGLIALDLAKKKGNSLYIDLGTNGEIVLKKGGKITTTSTAAGPAFEGVNISSGMLALPGAIDRAYFDGGWKISTIQNKAASGICGTGLIDIIAISLDKGEISKNGKITSEERKIHITDKIFIHQKDVREIQLAIAAIKTGIRMMLQIHKLKKEDLDSIFIAGAFGNFLNIKNSIRIGLLPQIDPKKISFLGNSALQGAKAILLSQKARKEVETLIKRIQFISLASDQTFQKEFIEALQFPENG